MKVVVLNYYDQCVEIYEVPKKYEDKIDTEEFEPMEYDVLSELGIDTNSTHWMFVDEDVEIYWGNEGGNPIIAL